MVGLLSEASHRLRDLVASSVVNSRSSVMGDAQALAEEGHLLEALAQGLEVKFICFEDLEIRSCGAGFRRLLRRVRGGDGAAVCERHAPHVALAADFGTAGGQGVDDEMPVPGVPATAELAAGVEGSRRPRRWVCARWGRRSDACCCRRLDAVVCLDGDLTNPRGRPNSSPVDEVDAGRVFAGRADVHA